MQVWDGSPAGLEPEGEPAPAVQGLSETPR